MSIPASKGILTAIAALSTLAAAVPPAEAHSLSGTVWGEVQFTNTYIGYCQIGSGPIKRCYEVRAYPRVRAEFALLPGIYTAEAWLLEAPNVGHASCWITSPSTGCSSTCGCHDLTTHYAGDTVCYSVRAELYERVRGRVDGAHDQGGFCDFVPL